MEFQATLAPTGDNFGSLTAATHLTCVPAPGSGRGRWVFTVNVHNTTGGAIAVNLYINDTAGTRYQIGAGAPATLTTYSLTDDYPNGIFLRDSQYLELNAGVGVTEDWYSAWADLPQLGAGGRI